MLFYLLGKHDHGIALTTVPVSDGNSGPFRPLLLILDYAMVVFFFSGHRKGSPVISILCKITANFRARATQAFL
jgi:hypothetical protein